MSRPDIFDVDIAGTLDDAMNDAGGAFPMTLTTVRTGARDPNNPTSGKPTTRTEYPCRGFVDMRVRKADGGMDVTVAVVVIFGASLPDGVEPQAGDEITALHERTAPFIITPGPNAVRRDPAGATYECEVGP